MNQHLQETINDYWTDRAPSYDAYQQRPERRELDRDAWARVWTSALPAAPADVLDVGTGSGHVACLLADLGHRVTGIDLAAGMLDIARQHAFTPPNPPQILSGDSVAPDFPSASYDAIVGRYVMWTLRDPEAAVANWIELLRPGGIVAMVDSTWFIDGLGNLYGDRPEGNLPLADAHTIDDTAEVLRGAGLLDVMITPLEEILELDRAHGVAPGHDIQLQYLVSGRTPWPSGTPPGPNHAERSACTHTAADPAFHGGGQNESAGVRRACSGRTRVPRLSRAASSGGSYSPASMRLPGSTEEVPPKSGSPRVSVGALLRTWVRALGCWPRRLQARPSRLKGASPCCATAFGQPLTREPLRAC